MNAKSKSNSVVTHSFDEAAQTLTFVVRDAGTITLPLAKIDPAVATRAMLHGLVQRISDRAAMDRNPETGLPATPADKYARMADLAAHYASGSPEWSPARPASGTGGAGATIRAVAAVKGKTVEAVEAWLVAKAGGDADARRAVLASLRAHPDVAAEIARQRAGSAPSVDLDEIG